MRWQALHAAILGFVHPITGEALRFQTRPPADMRALEEILAEQKRTNRMLQAVIYGGLGFVLGLVTMQLINRWQVF